MKKFVSTDLGGAPVHKNDLRDVFNSEMWDVMQGMYSFYDASLEGVIVKGCVVTPNASNFDISAGIVYLNGEFMRLAAATNQTFPQYIAAATPTSDLRTYADLTTHAVIETKNAALFSSPQAGQNITISSIATSRARIQPWVQNSVQFLIDGGGAVISAGHKGHQIVRWDCTIQSCMLLSELSGSIVINLWKDVYANFPPTVGDSIVATAKPTLSSAQKSLDTTLTGWTLSLSKGDIIGYSVESATTVQRVTLDLPVIIR